MKHVEAQVRKAWVNDYLDLYLYAGTIGDTQWQRDIMDTLRNADKEITDAVRSAIQTELWKQYDSVNRKILFIYEQLRGHNNENDHLKEKIWELKLERISLARQLRA